MAGFIPAIHAFPFWGRGHVEAKAWIMPGTSPGMTKWGDPFSALGVKVQRGASLPAPISRGEGAQAEGVEADEAGGVLLVIGAAVVLEGHQGVGVERLRALAPRH